MCEQAKRHRNRGQWHVCEWCGEDFEGEPLPGGYCTEECYGAADLDREYRNDLATMELYE